MAELSGKTALITGASRGIGRAIALRFAAEGAAVVAVASRHGQHAELDGTLDETVADINAAGGRAVAIACDLSDAEARGDLVARARAPFGAIDILVNNAAGSSMNLPSQTTTQERSFMFDMNVNGPIDLAQQALPAMRERGQGWILNISSATAFQPRVPYRGTPAEAHVCVAYGATKAALDRYSEGLAHEVCGDGVYVNTLAPEAIVLTQGASYVRNFARKNPDMAEPVEMMAEAALALCSGQLVGQVTYSRSIIHALGRPVKSLDGKAVLGDAFMPADLEATD